MKNVHLLEKKLTKNSFLLLILNCLMAGSMICQTITQPQIKSIEQHVAKLDLNKLSSIKNLRPVIIIGSGPAGLTAAMYLARAKLKPLVITGDELGGQLTEASYVENFPTKPKMSGIELMNDAQTQAEKFGAELLKSKVKKIDFSKRPFEITLENEEVLNALAIIIATGGSQRTLDIPGVKEFWGKGIGVCSICDAPFDKGKDVAIIGGGDAAGDRALQLSAYAKQVTLLVRAPAMRAAAVVQDYLKTAKNISIMVNVDVKKIVGKDRVEGVEIVDSQTGKSSKLPVQAVYFALGFIPRTELFKGQLDLTKDGYIKLFDDSQSTSIKGVFAAGTVEDPRYQKSATAAGNGSKAGMDAIDYLQSIGFNPEIAQSLEKNYYQLPKE